MSADAITPTDAALATQQEITKPAAALLLNQKRESIRESISTAPTANQITASLTAANIVRARLQQAVDSLLATPKTISKIETVSATLSFASTPDGSKPDGTIADMGNGFSMQLWTANGNPIIFNNHVASSYADGSSYIVARFTSGPQTITGLTMRQISGSTTGGRILYSLGTTNTLVSLPASGVISTPMLADTITYYPDSGRGVGFESLQTSTQKTITTPDPEYTKAVQAAKDALAAQDREIAKLSATLTSLHTADITAKASASLQNMQQMLSTSNSGGEAISQAAIDTVTASTGLLAKVSNSDAQTAVSLLAQAGSLDALRASLSQQLATRTPTEFTPILNTRAEQQKILDALRLSTEAITLALGTLKNQPIASTASDTLSTIFSAAKTNTLPANISLTDLSREEASLTTRRNTVATSIGAGAVKDLATGNAELGAIDSALASITTVRSLLLKSLTDQVKAAINQGLPAGVAPSAARNAVVAGMASFSIKSQADISPQLLTVLTEAQTAWMQAQSPIAEKISALNMQLKPMIELQNGIAANQAKSEALNRQAETLAAFSAIHGVAETADELSRSTPTTPLTADAASAITRTMTQAVLADLASRFGTAGAIQRAAEALPLLAGPSFAAQASIIEDLQTKNIALLDARNIEAMKVAELQAMLDATQKAYETISEQILTAGQAKDMLAGKVADGSISAASAEKTLADLTTRLTTLQKDRDAVATERKRVLGMHSAKVSALAALDEKRALVQTDITASMNVRQRMVQNILTAMMNWNVEKDATPEDKLQQVGIVQNALELAFAGAEQAFHDIENVFALAKADLLTARRQGMTPVDTARNGGADVMMNLGAGTKALSLNPQNSAMLLQNGGKLSVLTIAENTTKQILDIGSLALTSATWSEDSSIMVTTGDGTVRKIDPTAGTILFSQAIDPTLKNIRSFGVGIREYWLADSASGVVVLRKNILGTAFAVTEKYEGTTGMPALNGMNIVTSTATDGTTASSTIKLYSRGGLNTSRPVSLDGTMLSVLESPDERTLFAVTKEGAVTAIDSQTLDTIATYQGGTAVSAKVTPGGRFLLVLDTTGSLKVLDVRAITDRVAPTLVTSLATKSGTKILSATERTVTIDTPQGPQLIALPAAAKEAAKPLEKAESDAALALADILTVRERFALLHQQILSVRSQSTDLTMQMMIDQAGVVAKARIALTQPDLPLALRQTLEKSLADLTANESALSAAFINQTTVSKILQQTIRTSNLDTLAWTRPAGRFTPAGAVGSFEPHGGGNIYGAFLSVGGGMIITYGQDGRMRMWTTQTGEMVESQTLDGTFAYAGDTSPDGNLLAIGTYGHTVFFIDPHTGARLGSMRFPNIIDAVRFSPAGDKLYVNSYTGGSFIVDVPTRTVIGAITEGRFPVFINEGKTLLKSVGSPDGGPGAGVLSVYDMASQTETSLGQVVPGYISAMQANADGSLIAVGSANGYVAILDGKTLAVLSRFTPPAGGYGIDSFNFSPGSPLLAVQRGQGSMFIYDTRTAKDGQAPTLLKTYAFNGYGGVNSMMSNSTNVVIAGNTAGSAGISPTLAAIPLPSAPGATALSANELLASLQSGVKGLTALTQAHNTILDVLRTNTEGLVLSQIAIDTLTQQNRGVMRKLFDPQYTPFAPLPEVVTTAGNSTLSVIGSTVIERKATPEGTSSTAVLWSGSSVSTSAVLSGIQLGSAIESGASLASLQADLATAKKELASFSDTIKTQENKVLVLNSEIAKLDVTIAERQNIITKAMLAAGWGPTEETALKNFTEAIAKQEIALNTASLAWVTASDKYKANPTAANKKARLDGEKAFRDAKATLESLKTQQKTLVDQKSTAQEGIQRTLNLMAANQVQRDQLVAQLGREKSTLLSYQNGGKVALEERVKGLESQIAAMNNPEVLNLMGVTTADDFLPHSNSEAGGFTPSEQMYYDQAKRKLLEMKPDKILASALSRYTDGKANASPVIDAIYVRDNSVAGKIYNGLYQNMLAASRDDRLAIAAEAEYVLGVSAKNIYQTVVRNAYLHVRNTTIWATNYKAIAQEFRAEFESKGFASIFSTTEHSYNTDSTKLTSVRVTGEDVSGKVLQEGQTFVHGGITLNIDVVPGSRTIENIAVYLMDSTGKTQFGTVIENIRGTTWFTIPLARLNGLVTMQQNFVGPQAVTAPGALTVGKPMDQKWQDNFILRTVVFFKETGLDGKRLRAYSDTNPLSMKWDGKETSANSKAITTKVGGKTLSAEQQKQVNTLLDGINLAGLPEGNRKILDAMIQNFINSGELKYDGTGAGGFELEGTENGTLLQQCKDWLQNNFVKNATDGYMLPNNIVKDANGNTIDSYEWFAKDGISEIVRIRGNSTFQGMITPEAGTSTVRAGDIVQMAYGSIQHTMVITTMEKDGLWVFDTNWGEHEKVVLAVNPKDATGIVNANGVFHELTKQERDAGVVATHWYQPDDTVRLHFISYANLNSKATYATIYRVQ